jgi:magnesium-transporting ATPase (P-type)
MPLSCIVFVTALKDLIEDNQRKKSDTEENNRIVQRVENHKLMTCRWKEIRVGDVIKVELIKIFISRFAKMNIFHAILFY